MNIDLSSFNFDVEVLGPRRIPSPLKGKRQSFVNVPIPAATFERQKIDVNGSLWRSVLACTGQEKYFDG